MAVVNNIAYIEKTLPGVVDEVFKKSSLTERLLGGNELKLEFLDARTVKVTKMATSELDTYQRGGHGSANARGGVESSHEIFTLSQERYSEIPLDRLDVEDDGGTVLGNTARIFIETKVVPEFDTYRFSKLASYTSAFMGNRVSETIAANTIISKFNAAFKWAADNEVPVEDQVLYVSTTVMQLIRNTTELAKRLMQSDMDKDVKFTIERYEGREIVEVPENRFYTDAVVGKGIYPGASSYVINFLLVSKKACNIIKKLDFAKVYNSDGQNGTYLGYVGYLLTNLYYHDLFVPENKIPGIYCSVSQVAATTVARNLLLDFKAGASGKSQITKVLSNGIMYDSLGLYTTNGTAPAVGSSFAITPGTNDVHVGVDFTPNASHNIVVAVLDGKVVAASKDFTSGLPVGA